MATKSILLGVTDPQALVEINRALGPGWEATSVASEAEALAQLDQRSFDALLVDFNLGTPDASEVLNQTLEKCPETARFLLAYEADLALVAAKVLGSHQILPKPIEPASLKSRIENGVNEPDSNPSDGDAAKDAGGASAIPPVYAEVLKALDSPVVTYAWVGEIVARDPALKAELLRLTKSAYMGLPHNFTDPAGAVESLGLETVKVLVMALRFLAEHRHLAPGYLSFDRLWQHSANVGQIARDLVLFETRDRTLASQALAAGLVHDLGKVVLVTNFDDLYGRVHSLARKQPVPLWEIEKEMFGANHGEIGACLVGMWNLPSAIVESAALHHEPPLGEHHDLTPLAAVHIANVLEHELRPTGEFRVAPIINTTFLNELGLLQRLPLWRATSANRGAASQRSHLELETSPSGSLNPGPEEAPRRGALDHVTQSSALTRTSTETVAAARSWKTRWVYMAVAAGVVTLLTLWVGTQPYPGDSGPISVRARTATSLETAPRPQIAPATAPSDTASASSVSAVSKSTISTTAPRPPRTPTAHRPGGLPDFRLSGIICSESRPSAIVNGKTVYVGDRVSGARVISICQTGVTLQSMGQLRTCTLPSASALPVRH